MSDLKLKQGMSAVEPRLFSPTLDWTGEWKSRIVNQATALAWIPRFHYSGDIGHTGATFYGVFCPDLIAVVGIGPATNAHGLASRFQMKWPGNREITRVAVHPDAPRFSTSRSIALALRLFRDNPAVEWVFAYADTGQNHHGGIYQALNAIYLGMNVGGTPPPQWEIHKGGEWQTIASRTLQRKCGTGRRGAIDRLARRGIEVRIVAEEKPAKHAFLLPTSGRRVNRAIRRHLAPYAQDYPKRGLLKAAA